MEIPKIHFAFLFLLPIIAGIEQGAIQAEKQKQQLVVDTNQRVDCLPSRFPVANKKACDSVGCIWDPEWDQYHPTVPQCYFPAGCQGGYQPVLAADDQSASKVISLRWPINSPLQNPYSKPNLEIKVEPRAMGAALTVSIGNSKRFVPPIPLNHGARIKSSDDNEKLLFTQNTGVDGAFSFTVERKSDGLKIWDTSIGGFVFGDKFIQIATYLPTDRIYGFGENLHHQLKHDFSVYKTWGMFARDQPEDAVVPGSVNEYGVHPFYMGLESSGKAHGVFFLNSNAQEYTTGPAPHLIYRTIGGQLDLFFFPGPTPEEVIQQYQEVIGRPYLPAYWAFGYQLCRFGYKTLANLKAAVKRTQEAQIPLDVQYADIDYMEHFKDFTYDKENFDGFPQYADELHNMSMKLVLLFDPPVQVNYSAYQNALKMGASFVEWPIKDQVQNEVNDMYEETAGTKVMLGPMWPDYHTAFPDFFDPDNRTTKWWVDEYVRFRKELPFDGVWIDMNEPAVFGTNEERPGFYDDPNWKGKPHIQPLQCPHSDMDFPPYRTWNVFQYMKNEEDKISLCQNTLCMIGKVGRGAYLLYDTHSLYGLAEMIATREAQHAATGGKRGMIISRSTFPSAGHYGSHWLGDNNAKWPDLRLSIIGIQEFNMFGIPHVGADVCGFFLDTTEELCLRWQQLGAFYPYYRNHNMLNQKDQDPAQWPSVAKATREANLYRYRHLPYLYSLQFHATLHGGTVVRPMFFEFPLDPNTHSMSFQFMWGPAVVVVPVITGDVDTVRGYLPPHNEIWYSMSEAHEYGSQIAGGHSTFNAPRDTPLPTFLRGGYIIPRQEPDLTTTAARKRPFQLLVGLKSQGATSTAEGELYWDDGESAFDDIAAHPYYHFQFKAEANVDETKIHIKCTKRGNIGESLPSLDQIEVFGHLGTLNLASVKLNGKPVKMILSGDHSIAKREVVRIWCCQLGRAGLVDMNAVAASEGEWTTLSWENVPGGGKGNGAGNGRKWLATAGGWSLAIITMLLPSAIRALMGVDVV